jgi:arylsulfatase A-like enzyme
MTQQNNGAPDFQGVIGHSFRTSTPWAPPNATPPDNAPNIVFVVLDDVGFAHLGCYGSNIQTPHLDRLAAGGRRYNNFHTASMCSPTRASLLTGRNHHAAGMGTIVEWCTGYPGYQGQLTPQVATLAEMLRPHGYNSFALGKWHLTRQRDCTAAGPFDQWPLGRGFDRFYGFLNALMDQWNPELTRDNQCAPTPRTPGYHLTEDLIDNAIGFIRDQQAAAPGKPFFSYVAMGACHSPHHAPQRNIDKYKGQFDCGWDETRRRWLERQRELGIVPADTELTPLNPLVTPWAELTPDQQRLCARMQEVFAGFLDHTDEQIGRLIDYLEQRGLMHNTLFVVLSDNGASDEGGAFGDANIRNHYLFMDESLDDKIAKMDLLGSEHFNNHYPRGWGHAGNTPLKWFKMDTHGGGIRDPLIVHWPARIREGGQISPQFLHCSDIVPTILEAVGVVAPSVFKGMPQRPIDGRSMVYTFEDALAKPATRVQYFEMNGDRGIWCDGWKAVTRHEKGGDFEQDRWELYHVELDFSENKDLAATHPEKLQELIALWWSEAERHQVLPLDDRDRERSLRGFRPRQRTRIAFEQGANRLDRGALPQIGNRSYSITADVEMTAQTEGVILAQGDRFGGFVLFVQNQRLVHEYVASRRSWVLESDRALMPGRHRFVYTFRKTASFAGVATLQCDGELLGTQEMHTMWPLGPNGGGAYCGRDDGSPVSERYTLPFAFTGTIHEVVVEVGTDYTPDSPLEHHLALSED